MIDKHKTIPIYYNSLIILVGVSGSGKSTFSHKNFPSSMIVSTDECRRMICGSHLNQRISDDAFDLFYTIIDKKLKNGYPAVADSTALKPKYRQRLLQIAKKYNYNSIILLFDIPLEVSISQDKKRGRTAVGKDIITKQYANLEKSKSQFSYEKHDKLIVCDKPQNFSFRFTHPEVEKEDNGPFDLIASLNGNYSKLRQLLNKLSYQNQTQSYAHPEKRKMIFMGDICNNASECYNTFDIVYNMWKNNNAYYVPGDKCHDLYLFFKNSTAIKDDAFINASISDNNKNVSKEKKDFFATRFIELYENSSAYLILSNGKLVVSHAGILGKWIGQLDKKIKSFCIQGSKFIGDQWPEKYTGKHDIVYSHPISKTATWKNRTININLEKLCVLQYPEKKIITLK